MSTEKFTGTPCASFHSKNKFISEIKFTLNFVLYTMTHFLCARSVSCLWFEVATLYQPKLMLLLLDSLLPFSLCIRLCRINFTVRLELRAHFVAHAQSLEFSFAFVCILFCFIRSKKKYRYDFDVAGTTNMLCVNERKHSIKVWCDWQFYETCTIHSMQRLVSHVVRLDHLLNTMANTPRRSYANPLHHTYTHFIETHI